MIDTLNKFMVSMTGDRKIQLLRPHLVLQPFSPDDALLLAAYLVAMAGPLTATEFDQVLEAVENL